MVARSVPIVEFSSRASIAMDFEAASEPAAPGAGRVKLAALPAASMIVPPLSDRASVPA